MANNGKSYLIDTTKCIGCRACQVACKQWNSLPAEPVTPVNKGSYENPGDLSETQWILVHFREEDGDDGYPVWNFVRNSCRHCVDAPCRQKSVVKDSIIVDETTGAVLFTDATKDENYEDIRRACPFDIPRKGADGALYKCRMCNDRVSNGELPACVKTCPTGALMFGDRDEMLTKAEEWLVETRVEWPDATVIDSKEARLLLLLKHRESMYKTQGV